MIALHIFKMAGSLTGKMGIFKTVKRRNNLPNDKVTDKTYLSQNFQIFLLPLHKLTLALINVYIRKTTAT